ncbi:hypothetical protein [Peptostreptococcus faecalis]|uniref:hypothetical protein n=1 Tax=Peptostreptococcus faecalis TaxID=2045015 RepID=UPI000C7CE23C|nr:hypothetical protein [Peptostreptococcus faecalis]
MSRKESKKNKPKKNRWVMKFMLFALVLFVISLFAGRINPIIPNIIAIVYVISGVLVFYKNLKIDKVTVKI